MLPFRRILFPVDFSDRCYGAAQHVEFFTGRFNAELILLNVAEPYLVDQQPFQTAAARLDRLRRFLPDDFRQFDVRYEVVSGDPGTVIVDFACRNEVDLIMMPTHGYGTFRRFLLGSVTAKILHDAPCPVWTDVHAAEAPPVGQLHCSEVICGVEVRDADLLALSAAAEIASEFNGRLSTIHALPLPSAHYDMMVSYVGTEFMTAARESAREQVRGMLERVHASSSICVGTGSAAQILSEAARQRRADLLVIGRSQDAGMLGRLRADGYSIIHHAPCPVLSV